MKFNPENIIVYEQYREKAEQSAREYDEGILRAVFEHPDFHFGEGNSADVYFLPEAPDLCVKVISRNKTKKNYDLGRIKILPHDSVQECKLTALAASSTKNAIIPMPLFVFEVEVEEGDDLLDVICMQRLDAVTVEEVLSGYKPLPKNFNLESFFGQFEKFLDDIHEEGIHHQDLHGGNVMIDNATGGLCVIDFGASKKVWGGEETPKIDESCRKTLMKELRQYVIDNASR